jgi:hypothetical protein
MQAPTVAPMQHMMEGSSFLHDNKNTVTLLKLLLIQGSIKTVVMQDSMLVTADKPYFNRPVSPAATYTHHTKLHCATLHSYLPQLKT